MNKLILILIFIISSTVMAQQPTPKDAFLEKWENSKEYLLEIAELMPEEKYNYKPTEREMSFKDQLLHIRGNMLWLSTTYFSSETFDRDKLKENLPKTKEETLQLIKQAFEKVYQKIKNSDPADFKTEVDFFAGPKTKLQILNLLQDHVTHHRGQLLVYLNLNEVKPPRYVGW
ncbi:DinB family protein [Aquimarina sp. 2201CG5-10]|uniref:DinB family protein n=1 Tax=Aquimarina callyspongiae TaxID=3098150 RepID=UPI002AB39272|nr:DinB family protein [Aquimarina sp. 2201CG5-10]MDY8137128.1 DinB family protein [Aquimarina sp. 2201CG5-10]